MKIVQAAKEQMTDTLKLPRELVNGDSVITMRGCEEVFVENYRGILECSETLIWISTKNFRLCIEGRNLSVAYYTNDEMKVTGNIEHISFME
ncbi:MAG: YabP/YqfC family sporulation protein [Lachnospiraceae bacterium]